MARKKQEVSKEIPELNLGPIMNMVVILIPLLLLSVVFTEVGVINITAPKLAMGAATDKPPENDEEPLNLTIVIGERGINVTARNAVVPPVSGCPTEAGAPTICLIDPSFNMNQALADAIKQLKGNDAEKKTGSVALKTAVNKYNWRQLYNVLSQIKEKNPTENVINISAEPTIPYTLIVRAMDMSRYKLNKASFSEDAEFWAAEPIKEGDSYASLFPDPVLNLAK